MASTAARVERGRPAITRMVWSQLRHANRGFWRTPVAAFFTIVFPLLFLLLLGSLFGNETIDARGGIRVAQFLTPAIAAFAATTASFTALATGLSIDREQGLLKRVRGTPLRPGMFMAARIGSTVWIALLSVLLMIAVGIVFFDVQVVVRTLPSTIVTLAAGIGCFASLGLAVVAVSPSFSATQALTNATIIPLAFISDVFTAGIEIPRWLDSVGWVFPLKHFVNALVDTFNPFLEGPQFGWEHLAVMAAWGAAGLVVALRFFRWEPRPAARTRAAANAGTTVTRPASLATRPAEEAGRPGIWALVLHQIRYANRAFARNAASAFFVLVFPVILLLLLPLVFGQGELPGRAGIPLTQFLAPVLGVYGAATAAYADFSQRVAFARDRGILKRIHGTPLPLWAYLAGRIGSAVSIAFASLVLTLATGVIVYGVEVVPRALPGVLVSAAVGIGSFAAVGLAIAAIAPDADSVPMIANATLLPLAFFSDIFLIGDIPRWMQTLGSIFPLRHLANAVADGFNPTVPGSGFFPDHLAVMALWLVLGVAVAMRFWTWQPRQRAERGAPVTRNSE